MPKEISERVDKRNVVCMNCKHEFVSQIKEPMCSMCNSTTIVAAKDIGDRMAAIVLERKINERLDHLESVVSEMRKSVTNIKKALNHVIEVQNQEIKFRHQIVNEVKRQEIMIKSISNPNSMDIHG